MKMDKAISTFGHIEIEKKGFLPQQDSCSSKVRRYSKSISVYNISFCQKSYKYFIGYWYNIIIRKLSHYIQCFLNQAVM